MKRAALVIGSLWFCVLGACFSLAQLSAPLHMGVVQDWSQRHIIFSRSGLAQKPALVYREPRVLSQALRRWQPPNATIFQPTASLQVSSSAAMQRDWNFNLRGRLATGTAPMSPAKYSFDPSLTPNCASDYVVFGLTQIGGTGVANLVGLNNLYAPGTCLGPTVLFAYNITTVANGHIVTSPVLSADGSKIAFVESVGVAPRQAIFHVLTWTAGQGNIGAPAIPTMTSLPYSPAAQNTNSSPWVDYANDVAYVGADDGSMYKITGVFRGTPALAGAPWPVTVGTHPTSPVQDRVRQYLMVGSTDGKLYRIDTTNGAVSSLAVGGKAKTTGRGIYGAPLVDITNGTTFAVSGNDGTSGVIVEADTASLTQLAKANIGQASASGTLVKLFDPAVSNDYFTDPSSGVMRVCGTGFSDTSPWLYSFPFVGRTMSTAASASVHLLASTGARCTDLTEFFNPNLNNGTDFFFFGLTTDCAGTGTSGCVVARSTHTAPLMQLVPGGSSDIIIDNFSTTPDASSIYFTAGAANTAYKVTQNGLQ